MALTIPWRHCLINKHVLTAEGEEVPPSLFLFTWSSSLLEEEKLILADEDPQWETHMTVVGRMPLFLD